MASIQSLLSLKTPTFSKPSIFNKVSTFPPRYLPTQTFSRTKQKKTNWVVVNSMPEDLEMIPMIQSSDLTTDQQNGVVLSFEGAGFSPPATSSGGPSGGNLDKALIDRIINASIVLAAGSFAVTKLLTIDQDYWHGWTIFEIVRYAPLHNWIAYEEALKTNPVLAKMVISGVVYSVGDWIAQCVEGKPLFEFDRLRMLRSGLVGFTLHGSLSHYYYQFCEVLFPFHDWWVVPVKVVFDQTIWSAIWNSIYFVLLGFLRFENPINLFNEWKATFFPMLTAGWKLWPFAHIITYGVIPVEQRLLWVDCVELIWVTILSTYSNEKSEARMSEGPEEANSSFLSIGPPEEK